MNLDRYRVPESVTRGEWIELPESQGARFRVRLPSGSNREWTREVMQLLAKHGVDVRVDDQGAVHREAIDATRAVQWQESRLAAFARLCVLEGPEGFDLALLLSDYYPALVKLFEIAQQRADAEDAEVKTAAGES